MAPLVQEMIKTMGRQMERRFSKNGRRRSNVRSKFGKHYSKGWVLVCLYGYDRIKNYLAKIQVEDSIRAALEVYDAKLDRSIAEKVELAMLREPVQKFEPVMQRQVQKEMERSVFEFQLETMKELLSGPKVEKAEVEKVVEVDKSSTWCLCMGVGVGVVVGVAGALVYLFRNN